MITPAQCRAARGLVDLSQQQLADAAKVGVVTVRQFESGAAQPRNATAEVIQRALEAAGVEFTNGGQPGVRIRKEFKPGDFVKATQFGPTKVGAVGRDPDGEIRSTIEVVPVDKRK